ncbi:VWA domain-containing protein [Rariglobus hedericola]|uniref:DUF3520 domain-containing protein n=1 Tax=Rariglobus hedericola TaxID=2597822 RepID=A0A556QK06_9BACT|nr:VWA domain-containing protein [Rariglobus hedericola]TSJ76958.1 DUF3520 domain-containing protein [Rariglobus hedericola]
MNHDSHENIFPADPRITAYAFGELEGDELKLIEAAVQADPALQAAVAELRGFGDTLTSVLGEEPAVIEDAARPAPAAAPKKRRGLLIPFPLHYLATAAAACFAVVVWVRHEPTKPELESIAAVENTTPVSTPAVAFKVAAEPPAQRAVALVAADTFSPASAPVEVKFDQSLGMSPAPVRQNLEADGKLFDRTSMGAAKQSEEQAVGGMISKGRSDYLAGNMSQAEETFHAVLAADSANPQAKAFLTRIQKEKAEIGELNRSRNRKQMLEEVSNSWQRPGIYAGDVATSAPVPSNKPLSQVVVTVGAPLRFKVKPLEEVNSAPLGGYTSESYALSADNAYRTVEAEPLSTFSIDVDTASYSNVRRFLTSGRLPPRDAVRIEELINYFPYRYAAPKTDSKDAAPFAAKLEVASAPWAPAHRLVRVGLKAREFTAATRPAANIVFLLDVSGSMNSANKLPLVKQSLRLLVERLRPDDRVAIVTYAGNSGLALPSTPASQKNEILAALDNLNASGSTNGAMGIHLAYDIAKANFVANGGINRVILCTDGDFNVGVTSRTELVQLIEEKAKSRVFLSVFGFGMGNLKDNTLESLADKGNGAYGYIDTRREAEKVFVEQVEGTLATVAKDVKIQVEFNPARVASYRLIGYENRILAKEDFNNDAVDAGDIGAGHTVTALYEIVPVGVNADGSVRPLVDPLKYQRTEGNVRKPAARTTGSRELLTLKIRYKAPEGDVSKKQEFPLIDTGADFTKADGEFQFAAAVAAWGMLLRDSPHKGSATFEQVVGWAENGLGDDAGGYRAEFIQLVRRSAELK